MVLAMSVPRSWIYRQNVIDLVFGAVLLTILVQAPTTPLVLRFFNLGKGRAFRESAVLLRTRLRALNEAERYLQRQHEAGAVLPEVYEELRRSFLRRKSDIEEEGRRLRIDASEVFEEVRRELERQLALVEKETVRQAYAQGVLDEHLMRRLVREIDDRIIGLEEVGQA